MKLLEDRIVRDGVVIGNNILKVDSFLNHQLDINLFNEMGKEFKNLFKDYGITKILTIETSGIAIAAIAAMHFQVPVLFAKKHAGINMDEDVYQTKVFSYTKNLQYDIKVSKRLINSEDCVLIIDDFLASGAAMSGLINIVGQSGAKVAGIGIAIEKSFEPGRKVIEDMGIRVEALAIVDSMQNGNVVFKKFK